MDDFFRQTTPRSGQASAASSTRPRRDSAQSTHSDRSGHNAALAAAMFTSSPILGSMWPMGAPGALPPPGTTSLTGPRVPRASPMGLKRAQTLPTMPNADRRGRGRGRAGSLKSSTGAPLASLTSHRRSRRKPKSLTRVSSMGGDSVLSSVSTPHASPMSSDSVVSAFPRGRVRKGEVRCVV